VRAHSLPDPDPLAFPRATVRRRAPSSMSAPRRRRPTRRVPRMTPACNPGKPPGIGPAAARPGRAFRSFPGKATVPMRPRRRKSRMARRGRGTIPRSSPTIFRRWPAQPSGAPGRCRLSSNDLDPRRLPWRVPQLVALGVTMSNQNSKVSR
jgi:hypothetical protein